jgi:HPt (histidine-containing phosphotransfer) domain-containing protein
MASETTVKVYKRDALILKSIQNYLELEGRGMTQTEFIHEMLQFLLDYNDEFFKEIEKEHAENEKMMEAWMRAILKRAEGR